MSPETGRRFGPYEIQSRLGGGGMGHVFRAWDARLHREVAIKLLNHEYTMPGMRERFLREARAASALNHPNICSIFDIGEQDGDPYLVMELLEGETLRDRILARSMPLDEMVAVAREVAEALGAAHSKGVVHRDIKPANIFLVRKPNGEIQAKVLDFGLAKIEGGALGARGRSLELTTVGATVGTLAYMSPEQARGEVLDSRSDLFSLGVVMYEMATRQVPFQGATSALVFVQLLNHAPDPVREWNDAIPRDLEKIIFKLLAKERTARFQTARELELALLALNEKGGWLRKAVATVPLVRAGDPIVRGRKPSRPKNAIADGIAESNETLPTSPDGGSSRASGELIRPVARVPRSDARPAALPEQSPAAKRVSPVPPSVVPQDARISSGRYPGLPAQESMPMPAGIESPTQDLILPHRGSGDSHRARQAADDLREAQASTLRPSGTGMPWDQEREEQEQFPPLFEPARKRTARLPALPLWVALVAAGVLVAIGVLFYLSSRGHFGSVTLGPGDGVVVTEIENRTGNRELDGSITEALRIALAQSPFLHLRPGLSYQAARLLIVGSTGRDSTDLAAQHRIAERLGVRAFFHGSLTSNGSGYTLQVELRDVSTDDVLASAERTAASLQQVADAVDQVALDLRVAVGEDRSSIDQSMIPLAREGSRNLAALQLLAQADRMVAAREPISALGDLQQAVKLESRLTQAYLQLSDLYSQLLAETAAADAAQNALASAAGAGARTLMLAQARYEIERTGDYGRAATLLRHYLASSAQDSEALALLAQTLLREGHMGEALQSAQQAYAEDPFNAGAYSYAERALIGLDRYDAAFQLDSQVQRLGLARRDDSFTVAVLAGRRSVVEQYGAGLTTGTAEYRPDWGMGIYLDNEGRLAAGASFWRSRAESAAAVANLGSASAFLLTQGALDRAVLGDCGEALPLIRVPDDRDETSLGRKALFNAGMTHALCGDSAEAAKDVQLLEQRYPSSLDVRGFYVADIEAANALHGRDPAGALAALRQTRQNDLISLTPYLRGRAHADLKQMEIGIVDYQTVLSHRGTMYLAGSDVYPAAQIGVARAFAATGDADNSAEAYRQFLELWPNADPASSLLVEARQHSTHR